MAEASIVAVPEDTSYVRLSMVGFRQRAQLGLQLSALLLALAGCKEEPVDARPERAVEAFIERLKSVHGDPAFGRSALELLWADGRENLEERASRASAAAGRPVRPEEMLAPSRFSLNFEPKTFNAEIKGRHSRVTVTGEDVVRELAEIHCVQEDGHWRVVVHLPELSLIDQRDTK